MHGSWEISMLSLGWFVPYRGWNSMTWYGCFKGLMLWHLEGDCVASSHT